MRPSRINQIRIISLSVFMLFMALIPSQTSFANQKDNRLVYLPLVTRPVTASQIAWYSGAICTTPSDQLIGKNNPANFQYGFKELYVFFWVDGGNGKAFRIDWYLNGANTPSVTRTGTVQKQNDVIGAAVVYGENGTCGSDIPRGTYQTKLYVDNLLIATASAKVE